MSNLFMNDGDATAYRDIRKPGVQLPKLRHMTSKLCPIVIAQLPQRIRTCEAQRRLVKRIGDVAQGPQKVSLVDENCEYGSVFSYE